MKNDELDHVLKQALLKATFLDYEEILKGDNSAANILNYPDGFYRKLRKISANPSGYGRRAGRPAWKRSIQVAAAFMIVILLSTGGLITLSPTVRAAVLNWVMEVHEDYVMYNFKGADNEVKKRFAPAWIPDGYERIVRNDNSDVDFIKYRNINGGEPVYFDYMKIAQGSGIQINTSHAVQKNIKVNNMDAQLYLSTTDDGSNNLIWVDSVENYSFMISGYINEEELIRMAESVYEE